MLARGVIGRLAADVPKTSTHDLARLSQLVQRNLLSRNALSVPTVRALSRAYKAAVVQYRRSYATAADATKPTTRVKSDVKKAAAAKKTPAKKPAAKKTAAKKTTTKKKPVAKKKPAKKPAAKKAKPARKTLLKKEKTPEEKTKAEIKKLSMLALRTPVTTRQVSAWQAFSNETLQRGTAFTDVPAKMEELKAKYMNFTAAEMEHYNHLGNQKTAANRAQYEAWVKSHTQDEIRIANNARKNLQRRQAAGEPVRRRDLVKIHDDRRTKHPANAWIRFMAERSSSGDFKNIGASERTRLIVVEWKALSEAEKEPYNTAYANDMAVYKNKA